MAPAGHGAGVATPGAGGTYRPDIDGLRTLAVLPVVLFHAGLPLFSGGFVGVDVFFVISGYLITRILLAEVDAGRFSILRFYERRIHRIFPASMLVIVIALIVGLSVMLPSELMSRARNAASTVLFSSNMYLWWDAKKFFAAAPYANPLLHTWSLSVEEQVYIVWPIVTYVLGSGTRRKILLPVAIAATLCSFAMSWYLLTKTVMGGFYLFPPRGWKLPIGAILAIMPQLRLRLHWVRQAAGVAGLVLVILPVFLYSETTTFTGPVALPPCIGAALIILSVRERDTLAGRLLNWRPMVGIGLISYSLYLWHWPVIAFYRLLVSRPLTVLDAAMLVAISVVLAILSWRYVERPFRTSPRSITGRRGELRVVLAGGAVIVAIAGLCGAIVVLRGVPQRLNAAALAADRYPTAPFEPKVGCRIGGMPPFDIERSCFDTPRAGAAGDPRDVAGRGGA